MFPGTSIMGLTVPTASNICHTEQRYFSVYSLYISWLLVTKRLFRTHWVKMCRNGGGGGGSMTLEGLEKTLIQAVNLVHLYQYVLYVRMQEADTPCDISRYSEW